MQYVRSNVLIRASASLVMDVRGGVKVLYRRPEAVRKRAGLNLFQPIKETLLAPSSAGVIPARHRVPEDFHPIGVRVIVYY